MKPTIEGLLKAGVLIKTISPCSSPIFPIKKPHSPDYRLVHLRIVNAVVDAETPVVPDPRSLFSNIPPDSQWYIVIDLCYAFFSDSLHSDSQHLFAFMYQSQQYAYTHLQQGYCESSSIFAVWLKTCNT